MSAMRNTKLNLVNYISVLAFSLLVLSTSAQKTYPADVEGIKLLQSEFNDLNYNETFAKLPDDPCLPTPYYWVTCSLDDTPRVTELNLGNRKLLFGTLPDFSSMDALEIIDLRNCSLVGEFPDFLAEFPKLKELNLMDNHFMGTVPTSLQKNKDLKLTLSGNTLLCFSDEKECKPTEEYIEGTEIKIPPGTPGINYVPGTPGIIYPPGTPGMPTDNAGSRENSLPIILGSAISFFVMFWIIV
ncbi:probable LRR receptor-like serine/threonine-protein kinase At5g16900 [Papaver somniferum]|uniref:probable LRR receptor-like serine/threonine-protein kinase At5g16900 n=1 Tax=Papaver somniferum TaxID=3469 RepID=UPI000E70343A|nr:probable LRR receptor-like serine/threonine-protein kinase At5g16900 [Papaver somniferum]